MNIIALTAEAGGFNSFFWILILVMIGAMYFLTIRPQKKEEAKKQDMLKNIEIGDEVVTMGGIVGRVVSISGNDETVLIETGSDRNRIRIAKWAIKSNLTQLQELAASKKAAADAKKAEKADKTASNKKSK